MNPRRGALFAFALAAFTCGSSSHSTLPDIRSIDTLRAAFERDAGKPRLLLLLSPT